jgi:hypothetical protein
MWCSQTCSCVATFPNVHPLPMATQLQNLGGVSATVVGAFCDRPGAKRANPLGAACAELVQWGRPWCSCRTPFGHGVREAGSGAV